MDIEDSEKVELGLSKIASGAATLAEKLVDKDLGEEEEVEMRGAILGALQTSTESIAKVNVSIAVKADIAKAVLSATNTTSELSEEGFESGMQLVNQLVMSMNEDEDEEEGDEQNGGGGEDLQNRTSSRSSQNSTLLRFAQTVADSTSNLIGKAGGKSTCGRFSNANGVVKSLVGMLSKVRKSVTKRALSTASFEAEVVRIEETNEDKSEDSKRVLLANGAKANIPRHALELVKANGGRINIIQYASTLSSCRMAQPKAITAAPTMSLSDSALNDTISGSDKMESGSSIVSLYLTKGRGKGASIPVSDLPANSAITIEIPPKNDVKHLINRPYGRGRKKATVSMECRWYDEAAKTWLADGCLTLYKTPTSQTPVCACNHLTDFMLIKVTSISIEDIQKLGHSVPTMVGILCCVYTFAFFLVLKQHVDCGSKNSAEVEMEMRQWAEENGYTVEEDKEGKLVAVPKSTTGTNKSKDDLVIEDLELEVVEEPQNLPGKAESATKRSSERSFEGISKRERFALKRTESSIKDKKGLAQTINVVVDEHALKEVQSEEKVNCLRRFWRLLCAFLKTHKHLLIWTSSSNDSFNTAERAAELVACIQGYMV